MYIRPSGRVSVPRNYSGNLFSDPPPEAEAEETAAEAIYEIVTEDSELEAVATVFENLLDDVDLV